MRKPTGFKDYRRFGSSPPLLTEEQQKEFIDGARRTWNALAADNSGDDCGRNKQGLMPRSIVIEIVMDCDHIITFGNLSKPVEEFVKSRFKDDRAAALCLNLLRKAFPQKYWE